MNVECWRYPCCAVILLKDLGISRTCHLRWMLLTIKGLEPNSNGAGIKTYLFIICFLWTPWLKPNKKVLAFVLHISRKCCNTRALREVLKKSLFINLWWIRVLRERKKINLFPSFPYWRHPLPLALPLRLFCGCDNF